MIRSRPSSAADRACLFRVFAAGMVALCSVLVTAPARAQLIQRPVAIQNARILTMDGAVIENGSLLIRGDKIAAVGSDLKLPMLAKKIDAGGGTITPGLIDAHSALGRSSASGSGATRKAEDAFDRYDTASLVEALRGGVTSIFLSPGSSAGTCGTGAILRLVPDPGGESFGAVLTSEAALCLNLGSTSTPIARLKTLAGLRKQFRDALEHRKSLEKYQEDLVEYEKKLKEWAAKQEKEKAKKKAEEEKKPADDKKPTPPRTAAAEKPPEQKDAEKPDEKKEEPKKDADGKPAKPKRPGRKPQFDIVLKALDREMPVRIAAHRSEDILNALELAEEFSFELILEGAAEAHLVAEELADTKTLVLLGNMACDADRHDDVYRRAAADPTAALTAAGVPWLIGSGAERSATARFLAMNAQLAAVRGSKDHPLHSVTAKAADALQASDKIGRLRPGLLADFVLWSGDPLDPASQVREVYIGGVRVFEASKKGGAE